MALSCLHLNFTIHTARSSVSKKFRLNNVQAFTCNLDLGRVGRRPGAPPGFVIGPFVCLDCKSISTAGWLTGSRHTCVQAADWSARECD